MNKLTIDFETRSKIDLKKHGAARYSEDESTEVLCLAMTFDGVDVGVWIPEKFRHIVDTEISNIIVEDNIDRADTIEAHYAGFEVYIWQNVMVKKYGFKPLDLMKIRCSASKASVLALPRSLGALGKALGLEEQKDYSGYRIMLKMCKPRKPTKSNSSEWHESKDDFAALVAYCKQDVIAEHEASKVLPELSPALLELFRYDMLWNQRGVPIDVKGCKILWNKIKIKEEALLLELQELTGGAVQSARQVAVLKQWIAEQWRLLPDLTKATVEKEIDDAPELVKRALEIRQELGKSSCAKIEKMICYAGTDGRARDTLVFHAASTGRWGGKGIQVHNLPRDSFKEKQIDDVLTLENNTIDFLHNSVLFAASKCIRGLIKAPKGKKFFCADYSSIEARILCWIAKENRTLRAFREGKDVYVIAAQDFKEILKDKSASEQRNVGKVAVLSLGYQGWTGAFMAMATGYGIVIPEDEAEKVITKWRANNPNIVRFWKNIELAAKHTIRTKEQAVYLGITFFMRDGFLLCRLLSGRCLAYNKPFLKTIEDQYGRTKTVIGFFGTDSKTKKYGVQYTYGGSLTENIVQATAMDLLGYNLIKSEQAKYKVIMHVHDEILVEVDEDSNELHKFEKTISQLPPWAKDFPLVAEGWEGKRYRK